MQSNWSFGAFPLKLNVTNAKRKINLNSGERIRILKLERRCIRKAEKSYSRIHKLNVKVGHVKLGPEKETKLIL